MNRRKLLKFLIGAPAVAVTAPVIAKSSSGFMDGKTSNQILYYLQGQVGSVSINESLASEIQADSTWGVKTQIKSDNYIPNKQGWLLDKDGTMYINHSSIAKSSVNGISIKAA